MERVAAIGHGNRSSATRAQAIAAAHAASPEPGEIDARDAAMAGREVTVAATDYGRDPVSGVLIGSSPHHVAIRRESAETGAIVIHLPRLGYTVR